MHASAVALGMKFEHYSDLYNMIRHATNAGPTQLQGLLQAYFTSLKLPLGQYAKKPDTFNPDEFSTATLIPFFQSMFWKKYIDRGCLMEDPNSMGRICLDAPFCIVMHHRSGSHTYEPISVASFFPNFKSRTLYIDQLQGGSTMKKPSRKARASRMKFEISPEEILFRQIVQIAQQSNFPKVGVRRSSKNKYSTVQGNEESIYDRIAAKYGLRRSLFEWDYYVGKTDSVATKGACE